MHKLGIYTMSLWLEVVVVVQITFKLILAQLVLIQLGLMVMAVFTSIGAQGS